MMAQYQAMRKSLPADVILLYRLGDFYEMFFEDAKTAAPILNVALTKRGGTPMCGVPYHAAQAYLARLLKAGKRVAMRAYWRVSARASVSTSRGPRGADVASRVGSSVTPGRGRCWR